MCKIAHKSLTKRSRQRCSGQYRRRRREFRAISQTDRVWSLQKRYEHERDTTGRSLAPRWSRLVYQLNRSSPGGRIQRDARRCGRWKCSIWNSRNPPRSNHYAYDRRKPPRAALGRRGGDFPLGKDSDTLPSPHQFLWKALVPKMANL